MENTSGDAGAPQDYELANVGARLGAYFIDGFAATILMYLFIFIAGATKLPFPGFHRLVAVHRVHAASGCTSLPQRPEPW